MARFLLISDFCHLISDTFLRVLRGELNFCVLRGRHLISDL